MTIPVSSLYHYLIYNEMISSAMMMVEHKSDRALAKKYETYVVCSRKRILVVMYIYMNARILILCGTLKI